MLYREDGTWYHHLKKFPGILFDADGYLIFNSHSDYVNNSLLKHSKDLHIPSGIASIPGYQKFTEEEKILVEKFKEEIIENDEQTLKEDKNDDGGLYPYDPAYSSIEIGEEPFSIYEYLRQLEKGKIIIQPDFQRNQVWNNVQKSQFVESIILNFPLPPIYLNETKEAQYIVIDGLQRSTRQIILSS